MPAGGLALKLSVSLNIGSLRHWREPSAIMCDTRQLIHDPSELTRNPILGSVKALGRDT
jgi:hypothetical protein